MPVHAPPSEIATAASAPSVGASPASLANAGPGNAVYTVQGGTVTKIEHKRGSTSCDTGVTAGSFTLGVGDILVITHSGAPTVGKLTL